MSILILDNNNIRGATPDEQSQINSKIWGGV